MGVAMGEVTGATDEGNVDFGVKESDEEAVA